MIQAKDLSPDAQFAFACFLIAEKNRHYKDIDNADKDLKRLKEMGVDVDKAYDMGFVTTEELGFA
jgi:fructose-1,6-bisphosphatase/sedoheptulose 1,7-bisphosphatase-like protein